MAKIKKEEENIDSVKHAAEVFYKMNKDVIYNDPMPPIFTSTGVLSIDYLLGGKGLGTGICRLTGEPGMGKSSLGLLIVKNFLETHKKSRGLIIPTEARLTDKLKSRSGVKFVHTPEEWVNGTCLILPTNVYEKIANFLITLVKTNEMHPKEKREHFVIMIDCIDYLSLESELEIEFGGDKNRRPAGPQYLTKILWSRLALPFQSGQHLAIFCSQRSAAPKLDNYTKTPIRQGDSSGGSALKHQANVVIDLNSRYESDYVLENPDLKYDRKKNDKIGHRCSGFIRKSDNERYDVSFEFFVKYGRTNGNSVWIERDVFDQLLAWEQLTREGQGSFNWNPDLYAELKKIDPNIPDKIRSANRAYEYLESQPKVTQFLVEKFKNIA